jgi:hypothetical protein
METADKPEYETLGGENERNTAHCFLLTILKTIRLLYIKERG